MTAVVDAPHRVVEPPAAETRAGVLLRHAPEATTLVAAAWWLIEVTRAWAGRTPGPVSIGALAVAVAVVVGRPWQWLPRWVLGTVAALSAGAFVVAASSPTGWRGAAVAASYVSAAWLGMCCAATVRRAPTAALRLVGLVIAAGLVEVAEAWLPWWGGADPTRPIIGTFYWHDPFAAFLLPVAILGLWAWARGPRQWALLGLVGVVLSTVGIVYSTSRAALACLGAAAIVLLISFALARDDRRRGVVRSLIAVAAAGAATYVVAGPPFFPHRSSAAAAIQARASGQSLGQNGGYRLQFWHEAMNLFARHPLTGGGYHSLATESVGHVPHGWALSPMAHNGYLQALSDGGLVLALPFLTLVAAVAWLVLRGVVPPLRHRVPDGLGFALALAVGVVMAHSFVDFDWTYAANLALFGVLAGLLAGHRLAQAPEGVVPTHGKRSTAAWSLVAVTALLLSAWAARHGDMHENLPPSSFGAVQAPTGTGR